MHNATDLKTDNIYLKYFVCHSHLEYSQKANTHKDLFYIFNFFFNFFFQMFPFLFLEYYENAYYPQYECNVPLLDQAALSATSSLRERGPENARLNGKQKIYVKYTR